MKKESAHNSSYPKDGVMRFEFKFSYKLTEFLQMKISSNLPALRVAATI